jgi:hypothetical protein
MELLRPKRYVKNGIAIRGSALLNGTYGRKTRAWRFMAPGYHIIGFRVPHKPNCFDTTGGRGAIGSGVETTGEPAEVLIPRFEDIGKQKKRDQGKLTMGFAFVRFDSALGARPAISHHAVGIGVHQGSLFAPRAAG